MKSIIKYRGFYRDKSTEELLYNNILCEHYFNFIKVEITFLNQLLKNYPFKSNIPNLFEHIQLFIKDLNDCENNRIRIIENITSQNQQIKSNFDLVAFESFAEEISDYKQSYLNLKNNIYEYLSDYKCLLYWL